MERRAEMLKKAVVIILLLCVVVGCDGRRKFVGGYKAYGKPDDILQLRQDGSFLKRETDEGTTTGTWEVVGGDEIILSSKPIGDWDGKHHLRVRITKGEPVKLVSRLGIEWRKM